MKNNPIIPTAILVLALLTSCHSPTIDIPPPEGGGISIPPYTLIPESYTEYFYSPQISRFCTPPTIYSGEILVADSWINSGESNLNLAIDIATKSETVLPFCGREFFADIDYYYWMAFDGGNPSSLYRMNKQTNFQEQLYVPPDDHLILGRLSFDGRYLVWVEEIYADDVFTYNWSLMAYDCKNTEAKKIAELNSVYMPTYKPAVYNGFVTFSNQTENGYIITAVDLEKNEIAFSLPWQENISTGTFNEKHLVWNTLDSQELFLYDIEKQTTVNIESLATGTQHFYKDKYLIYGKNNEICIFDLSICSNIYTTYDGDDYNPFYLTWMNIDEARGQLVASGQMLPQPNGADNWFIVLIDLHSLLEDSTIT